MKPVGETRTQRRERRITAWGLSFTYLIVVVGMQVVAALIAIFALISAAIARHGQSILQDQTFLTHTLMQRYLGMMGWILIISDVAAVLIFLFIVKGRHESFRETVGLRRFRPLLVVALLMLGAGLSLLLNSGTQILSTLFPSITSSGNSTLNAAFDQLFSSAPGIVSIILIAPIAEEIAFRGMVFGVLRQKLALPVALIVQAVIFGVFHGNIAQGLMAFGLGCLLAWVYLRSGSIICAMLVHFAFNGTTVLITLVTNKTGSGPIWLWLLLMLAAAGLFVGGLLWQIGLTKRKSLPTAPPASTTSTTPASGDNAPSMLVS